MKRTSILVISLLWISLGCYSQIKAGLKAGANLSSVIRTKSANLAVNESYSGWISYLFGSYISGAIGEQLLLQFEVLFCDKGFKHKVGDQTEDVGISYLNFPLLIAYQPRHYLLFEAGPEFGYRITGNEMLNHFDFAIDLGLNCSLYKDLNAGVRYSYGIP